MGILFEGILAIVLFLAVMITIITLINKPYYAIVVYYIGYFMRREILPNAQVRVAVAVDLILLAACLALSYIGYIRQGYRKVIRIPCLKGCILLLLAVVPLEVISGYLNGYAIFQILVDIYKVLEILIFFIFFQYSLREKIHIEKALFALTVEMCVLGVVEMVITNRGGAGLNIIISIFPIMFAWGINRKQPYYWLVTFLSILVAIICKTRTYLIANIAGIIMVLLLTKGQYKRNVLQKVAILGALGIAIFIVYAKFLNSRLANEILSRLLELFTGGFQGAGGYRIYEIRKALEKFIESPFIGKGYGYLEYVNIQLMGWFYWGDFLHNSYIEILLKTGLYGTILYGGGLAAYVSSFFRYISICRNNGWNDAANILVGGFAGTVNWLIIYFAAPLSSFGYFFIPGIISLLYYSAVIQDNNCK